MRYEDAKATGNNTEISMGVQSHEATLFENPDAPKEEKQADLPRTMEQASEDDVDKFQAAVYNAGAKALSTLDANELTKGLAIDRRKKAKETLKELGAFRYNIGFAGPQSCGKSSLINAIIRYPLMPTCNLATTCTPVELIYGKEIRIIVKDEDRDGKIVFDKKCRSISPADFEKLKNYSCKVMKKSIIENLQFFCDSSLAANNENLESRIKMDRTDPRQVALLFLTLFTVYVDQNREEPDELDLQINELRLNTLSYFGIPKSTINFCVVIQWDEPMLASGLMITDLPGLGADAQDKVVDNVTIKGHDTITKEAVLRTDTMAFMSEPLVLADAVPALKTMISNANLRDVVSPEDRIIPIMNKVDLFKGVAQKKTGVDKMLGMMRDAGADMQKRKIWETSTFFGEYAYESLDVKKSFYIQNRISDLAECGYNEDEIEGEIPRILEDMQRRYKHSGVDELREFFRSTFIGRGKYQRTLSTVVALKALALDMAAPLRSGIDSGAALASVDKELATQAMDYLKSAAITPLNQKQKTQEDVDRIVCNDIDIVDPMMSGAAAKYEESLSHAVDDYAYRLSSIVNQFETTWLGLGSHARVDSGHSYNHELYLSLVNESKRLNVNLAEVNKIHADALAYCSNAVAKIYDDSIALLNYLQKEYPRIMEDCIKQYEGKADPEVIALVKSLLPSLQKYVEAKVIAANAATQNQQASIQDCKNDTINEIVSLNGELVTALLDIVNSHINTTQGGWFTKKDYLLIDGPDGLKTAISSLSLTTADRNNIRDLITVKSASIINSLRGWYDLALNECNSILASLYNEFEDQFKSMKMHIENKGEEREKNLQRDKEALDMLCRIFAQMGEEIQGQFDAMLEKEGAGNSSLKGDLFEGMLKKMQEAQNG